MRKYILLLVFLAVFCSSSTLSAEIYEDETEKYEIDVPASWEVQKETNPSRTYFMLDGEESYLLISIPTYKYTASWASYVIVGELAKDEAVTRISYREQQLGDYLTSRIDYLYEKDRKEYHVRQNIIEGNEKLYILTFHALRKRFAGYVDQVNNAVRSFNVIIDESIKKAEKEYLSTEYSFTLKYPERWVEFKENKTKSTPLVLYLEPDIQVSVMVTPITYMKNKSTGLFFSADRAGLAADSGPLIKATAKKIQENIKKNNTDFKKYRQYSSEIDDQLAMELIVEYIPGNDEQDNDEEEPVSEKIVRHKDNDEQIRELYYLTGAGANVLSFIYSAPKKKFNRYLDEFEEVVKSIDIEVK